MPLRYGYLPPRRLVQDVSYVGFEHWAVFARVHWRSHKTRSRRCGSTSLLELRQPCQEELERLRVDERARVIVVLKRIRDGCARRKDRKHLRGEIWKHASPLTVVSIESCTLKQGWRTHTSGTRRIQEEDGSHSTRQDRPRRERLANGSAGHCLNQRQSWTPDPT